MLHTYIWMYDQQKNINIYIDFIILLIIFRVQWTLDNSTGIRPEDCRITNENAGLMAFNIKT